MADKELLLLGGLAAVVLVMGRNKAGATSGTYNGVPHIEASYSISPYSSGFKVDWSINNYDSQAHTVETKVLVNSVVKSDASVYIPPGEGRELWNVVSGLTPGQKYNITLEIYVDGRFYGAKPVPYTVPTSAGFYP